jgi:hypothetical protein
MSEKEAVLSVSGHEYAEATNLRKIIKIALCVLVLLFTFFLGDFRGWMRHKALTKIDDLCQQMDDFHLFVYTYDTKQKIEDYNKWIGGVICDQMGLSPISSEFEATMREMGRPLVTVGPFTIFFVDSDDGSSGRFSVRETQPNVLPLLELEILELSKRLQLFSSVEKVWGLPRFHASLNYSEDGTYINGGFSVHGEDGRLERIYSDTKGTGVFDVMNVFENNVRFTYRLNDLTWELVGEQLFKNHDLDIQQPVSPELENE